ncbi:hypothetical protein [Brevundimonas sp.]|uniref:hypothetical protein n=1 Tax=Brevundimonas sp. TaxID=1871086 RepID=UPI002600EDE5|nr:hypothetical protein [Brevundimonas sp.]
MNWTLAITAAAVLAAPTFALAQATPAAGRTGDAPSVQRVLYVCDRAPETRRAFQREHGEIVFVTAEEVLAAEARGDQWTAPRCISAAEARRLSLLRSQASR